MAWLSAAALQPRGESTRAVGRQRKLDVLRGVGGEAVTRRDEEGRVAGSAKVEAASEATGRASPGEVKRHQSWQSPLRRSGH